MKSSCVIAVPGTVAGTIRWVIRGCLDVPVQDYVPGKTPSHSRRITASSAGSRSDWKAQVRAESAVDKKIALTLEGRPRTVPPPHTPLPRNLNKPRKGEDMYVAICNNGTTISSASHMAAPSRDHLVFG